MKLLVRTRVEQTEVLEKVEAAVSNMFPTLKLNLVDDSLVGESEDVGSLSRLHQLLRQQAILDAARSVMIRNKKDCSTEILLNKQVAYVGRVSFADWEVPLGPIVVTLRATDLDRLIDHLAPKTREGKPIQEVTY